MLFAQLPDNCKTAIYTKFIFKEFLWKFRRFFRFCRMQECSLGLLQKQSNGKVNVVKNIDKFNNTLIENQLVNNADLEAHDLGLCQLKYPYFEYSDDSYCEFMLQIMS